MDPGDAQGLSLRTFAHSHVLAILTFSQRGEPAFPTKLPTREVEQAQGGHHA